jgi:hypothetical protein
MTALKTDRNPSNPNNTLTTNNIFGNDLNVVPVFRDTVHCLGAGAWAIGNQLADHLLLVATSAVHGFASTGLLPSHFQENGLINSRPALIQPYESSSSGAPELDARHGPLCAESAFESSETNGDGNRSNRHVCLLYFKVNALPSRRFALPDSTE